MTRPLIDGQPFDPQTMQNVSRFRAAELARLTDAPAIIHTGARGYDR